MKLVETSAIENRLVFAEGRGKGWAGNLGCKLLYIELDKQLGPTV